MKARLRTRCASALLFSHVKKLHSTCSPVHAKQYYPIGGMFSHLLILTPVLVRVCVQILHSYRTDIQATGSRLTGLSTPFLLFAGHLPECSQGTLRASAVNLKAKNPTIWSPRLGNPRPVVCRRRQQKPTLKHRHVSRSHAVESRSASSQLWARAPRGNPPRSCGCPFPGRATNANHNQP